MSDSPAAGGWVPSVDTEWKIVPARDGDPDRFVVVEVATFTRVLAGEVEAIEARLGEITRPLPLDLAEAIVWARENAAAVAAVRALCEGEAGGDPRDFCSFDGGSADMAERVIDRVDEAMARNTQS